MRSTSARSQSGGGAGTSAEAGSQPAAAEECLTPTQAVKSTFENFF